MKTYMPLNGLRWSRNSGSANCDMPQSAVFGRPGGGGYRLLLPPSMQCVARVAILITFSVTPVCKSEIL